MDVKLLVCDLDDTMIDESHDLPARLKGALEKAKEHGVKTAIATGRMYFSALPYVDGLGFDEVLISFNGAHIINTETNKKMGYCPLELKDAVEILEFAKEHNVYAQYYNEENYFFFEDCDYSNLYAKLTGLKGIATQKDLAKSLDFDPVKVLLMCDLDIKKKIYEQAKLRFAGRVDVISSKNYMIEFNNLKISKGIAAKKVANHYGIDMKNVMAIGNGDNDISMIESAGLGIAVANSSQNLKECADYITLSQEEDGVAHAIEKFILR